MTCSFDGLRFCISRHLFRPSIVPVTILRVHLFYVVAVCTYFLRPLDIGAAHISTSHHITKLSTICRRFGLSSDGCSSCCCRSIRSVPTHHSITWFLLFLTVTSQLFSSAAHGKCHHAHASFQSQILQLKMSWPLWCISNATRKKCACAVCSICFCLTFFSLLWMRT